MNFSEEIIKYDNGIIYNTFFIWNVTCPEILYKRVLDVVYTELNPMIKIFIMDPNLLKETFYLKFIWIFLDNAQKLIVDYNIQIIFVCICDDYDQSVVYINNYIGYICKNNQINRLIYLKKLEELDENEKIILHYRFSY